MLLGRKAGVWEEVSGNSPGKFGRLVCHRKSTGQCKMNE